MTRMGVAGMSERAPGSDEAREVCGVPSILDDVDGDLSEQEEIELAVAAGRGYQRNRPAPAPVPADETMPCLCPPCPGRGNDGHGMTHCAECCFARCITRYPPTRQRRWRTSSGGLTTTSRKAKSPS